ncbi:Hypothetical predicted protein, partial [Prunus dulcis]
KKSVLFRENIRVYNSMFAFTSMGAKIDKSINNGSSPYVFKISGQVHHLMGSLLPLDGQCPKFAQLYIYDTHNEVLNRLDAVNCNQKNEKLDQNIVEGLIQMFDQTNELITLLGRQSNDSKQYEQPTCDEIGGLIVGDIGLFDSNRDIIIEFKSGELKCVTKLNPKFMSLQYPLLFPFGEDGYTPDLKWHCTNYESKRRRIPMRAFIAYQIQERVFQFDTLLKGGRLFQQFLVDAYATLEEDRLDYIRKNQKNLRSEVYKGIYDAISKGDNDANNIGQRVILPSSYTGSARYMLNNYQDAMAICRQYGNPDLFITFTCNVKWPEIVREFNAKPGYKPEDRPDIVSRLFKIKLDDMINYIKSGEPFGEIEADVCTVEFRKRGLPHAHMLIWLKQNYKCYSAVDIDSIISAELPNKTVNYDLYNIVTQFMIHGSDRARVVFQENQQDEILAYLNCRYISPYEAVWRLFQYPIHFRKPSVERLPIHLPLEQNIIFNEPSYQAACKSLGLLGDDKEWIEALANAVNTTTCPQLRQLFVTIILFCDVGNPQILFNTYWQNMSEDILYKLRQTFEMPNLIVSESELQNSLLFELEQLFNVSSSSLKEHHLPMPDEYRMLELRNKLLREELNYDYNNLEKEHSILVTQLNKDQKDVYDCVVKTVEEKMPGLFFVHGHGGTGKTFLWHTII